jgi:hypothetical protein
MGQDFQTLKERNEYEKDQAVSKRWFINVGLAYLLVIVAAWCLGIWIAERFF